MSDTSKNTSSWALKNALWSLVVPGLGFLKYRRWPLALTFWLLPTLGLIFLAGRTHHLLHRPGTIIAVFVLMSVLWLAGVILASLQGPIEKSRQLPKTLLVFLVLAHWLWIFSLLFPPGIALVPNVPALVKEHPTDQNAVAGRGGLTAGLSSSGVMTLLRWPGPAGRDHVNWRAVPEHAPGFGATQSMGVFAGVRWQGKIYWFRDDVFSSRQRYASDDHNVMVTEHDAPALGLRAVETVFVLADDQGLAWNIRLESKSGASDKAQLLFFENLAPCTEKFPYLATSDWALDADNDFAAAIDTEHRVLLHFRPSAKGSVELPEDNIQSYVKSVDKTFGEGVYFAMAAAQSTANLRIAEDDESMPAALFGGESKARFQESPAVGGLWKDVEVGVNGTELTVYLSAGAKAYGQGSTTERLLSYRQKSYGDHLAEAIAADEDWLKRAALPSTNEAHVLRLAKRSLLVLRNAFDNATGAMVASVATQLPYALDWTRDGAFFNLALDEAGYPDMVSAHNRYYARVQRADGILAGTYPMNTYEDGMPGGPIFLEVDNAGLALWTMADHHRFLEGDAAQEYLDDVWPAIERGAEFFVRWRAPFSGLLLPAHEDDFPQPRQGIQGTVTAISGLRAAEKVAQTTAVEKAVLERWRERRIELEAALFENFWVEEGGYLADDGPKSLEASAWAIWPAEAFADNDPRATAHGDHLWKEIQRLMSAERKKSSYDAKLFLALAYLWGHDHPKRQELVAAYTIFAKKLPLESTGLLGEHAAVEKNAEGEVVFRNLNNMPHVWEHALHYLTIMRLFPKSPQDLEQPVDVAREGGSDVIPSDESAN